MGRRSPRGERGSPGHFGRAAKRRQEHPAGIIHELRREESNVLWLKKNRDRPAQRIREYVNQGRLRFDAADATRSAPQQNAQE